MSTEASLGWCLNNILLSHQEHYAQRHGAERMKEVFLTTVLLILPSCFSRTCSMASWRVGKKMEVWMSSSKNMQLCSFSRMYTVNPWAACYGFSQATFHWRCSAFKVILMTLTVTGHNVNIHINTDEVFEYLQRIQSVLYENCIIM